MSAPNLMIEAAGPNRVRIGLFGEPLSATPFFTVHVNHLGKVRQETVWCTAIGEDQLNSFLKNGIENIIQGDVYVVYISVESSYKFNMVADPARSIATHYFKYEQESVITLSENDYLAQINMMSDRNTKPLYATDENSLNQQNFEIVFFFAGAIIDSPSAMEGISIFPVKPGVSNASTFDAVSSYLKERHSIDLPTGEKSVPYLRYQPVFSIDMHNVVAQNENEAVKFATNLSHDISTIIGMERGDRPFPLLVFVLNHASGGWKILPTRFDIRGNLLAPMIASTNVHQVEVIRPILNRDPYARLIAELYVQSLAERDRSFRVLRQWSLLELISDRRIPSTTDALLNLDGSEIHLGSGAILTTQRKEGKVYAYLRRGNLPAIYQGTHSGQTRVLEGSKGGHDQGGGLISLWEAVAAFYSMRNSVAHDGRFDDTKAPKTERDILCKEFFVGEFGFLDHAVEYAVGQEIALSRSSAEM